MNKTILGIAAAVIIVGASFYAGDVYGKSGSPGNREQFVFANGQYGGMGMMRGGRGGGAAVAGQILSSDSSSVTIKLPTGSTQIILVGTTTQVFKAAQGTLGDLAPGAAVVITGTPNSDGSLTAQSVQIRPAGTNGFTGRPTQTQ